MNYRLHLNINCCSLSFYEEYSLAQERFRSLVQGHCWLAPQGILRFRAAPSRMGRDLVCSGAPRVIRERRLRAYRECGSRFTHIPLVLGRLYEVRIVWRALLASRQYGEHPSVSELHLSCAANTACKERSSLEASCFFFVGDHKATEAGSRGKGDS